MESGGENRGLAYTSPFLLARHAAVQGDSYLETCARRTAEGGGSLFVVAMQQGRGRFPLSASSVVYICIP